VVVPLVTDDSHAGGRLLNPPHPSDELPPTPPTPHLGARTLPLQHRDVVGVAILLLAVLVAAQKMTVEAWT